MKLGFRDMTFNQDFASVFALGQKLGVETVQVACPDDEAGIETLAGLVESTGIGISSITAMSWTMMSPDEEKAAAGVEFVSRGIAAAGKLGVGCVSQFVGNDSTISFEENIERYKRVYSPLAEQAEAAGTALAFENCPLIDDQNRVRNFAYAPVKWQAMFEAIPSRAMGLEFDTAHMPWMGIDVLQAYHDFADRIVHVHLKDCHVDPAVVQQTGAIGEFYEYGTPGDGDIDFPALVAALRADEYAGSLTLDLRPTNEETLTAGVNYMRGIL